MRRIILFCLGAAAAGLALSCSDNPIVSEGEPELKLDQLAQFDTSAYYMISISGYDEIEPFLTTERIIGEPFTDNNHNGVYEEGIDVFIIAVDPAINQDLNHNGMYDGPDSRWTPGIPFDDIDGNGLPRTEDDGYLPGAPYCDLNGNGHRDGEPYSSNICKMEVGLSDSTGTYFDYFYADSTYSFLSDSLIRYILSSSFLPPGWHLKVDIGGYHRSTDTLYFGAFPVLCGNIIRADSVLDSIPGLQMTYYRKTTLNTRFSFFDIENSGLVQVHIGVIQVGNYLYWGEEGDFYFSPQRGPVGYVFRQSWSVQQQLIHFGDRIDSLPIPMTR